MIYLLERIKNALASMCSDVFFVSQKQIMFLRKMFLCGRRVLLVVLLSSLVMPLMFMPNVKNAQATPYSKTWTSQDDFEKNASTTNTPTTFDENLLYTKDPFGRPSSPDASIKLKTWQSSFSETFDSNINNDVSKTTAKWDAINGNVTVPAVQSITSEQLDLKLGGVYGGSEVIQANIAIGTKTYLGLNNGKLLVYDSSSGLTTDITSKISSSWGGATFHKFLYDSTRGMLYMIGPTGRFLRMTIPGEVVTPLMSRLSSFWGGTDIYAITLDTAGRRIYLGGNSGMFARFDLDGDIVSPQPAEDLRSKIKFWLQYPITALEYENGNIYITGQWGFAVYSIASNTAMSLNDKLGSTYGSTNNNNAVIGVGDYVYIGSDEGVFLKHKRTAPESTEDLSEFIKANFGNYAIRKFAYDSVNNHLFIGGDQGRLIRFDLVTKTVVADFSGAMWGWVPVTALAFSAATNEMYVGGAYYARFLKIRSDNTYSDISGQVQNQGASEVLGLAVSNGKVFISAGTQALYYDIGLNQTFSLTEKMNNLYGASVPNIISSAVAGNIVYQGTSNGRLFAYNNSNGTSADITSRIPFWSGYPIYSMLKVNDWIYIGSYYGMFGRFNVTNSDPAENYMGLVRPHGMWGYYANVYEMTYDSIQQELYLAGSYNFFISIKISPTGVIGAVTNRRAGLDAVMGSQWTNPGGIAYSPSDNKIYIGMGDYGSRFFAYDMNFSTPTPSLQFTDLTSAVSGHMSGYPILDIVYAPDIDEMIIGGYYGRLAAYNIAGGTADNLSFNNGGFWGWNHIYKLWYSGNRSTGGIFAAGTGGKFAQLRWSGPGFFSWKQYDLSSYIVSAWSTWSMNSISGVIGTDIFLVGDSGRFVRYNYATNAVLPLTATYNAFFPCVERFMAVETDATGRIFFGSASGKLAVSSPSPYVITDTTASLTGWGATPIYQMSYSDSFQMLSVAGPSGKLNYIDYNASTSNTTGSLSTYFASFWGANSVNSVTFVPMSSTYAIIYIAGTAGQFAYIDAKIFMGSVVFVAASKQPSISKYLRLNRYFYSAEYVPAAPASIYIASTQTDLVRYEIAAQTATVLNAAPVASGIIRVLYFSSASGTDYLYLAGDGGRFSRLTHGTTTFENLQTTASGFSGYWGGFIIYDVSAIGQNFVLSGERTRLGEYNETSNVFTSKMIVLGGHISFYGNVLAMAADTDNNNLYIGLDGGRLGRLDPSTTAQADDLTGLIAPYFGGNAVRSIIYANNTVFVCGDDVSFVKLTNLSAPLPTVTDLEQGFRNVGWFGNIRDLVYVPGTPGTVYLAGSYSQVGTYTLSGAVGYYRTRVANSGIGYWGDIYCIAYEPNANAVYFGGQGVFGKMNNDITGNVVNLFYSMYVAPSYMYTVLDMAVSTYNGDVYLGSSYQFGKYSATGAFTDFSANFRASFGWQYAYSLSYDDSRRAIYIAGTNFFGKHDSVADITFNFTSQVGVPWGTTVYAIAYVPSINKVYIGGSNVLRRTTMTTTYHAVSRTVNPFPFPMGWATVTSNYVLGAGGLLFYQISNNGGISWRTVGLNSNTPFGAGGSQLQFRIVLDMNPTVYDISISYGGYYQSAAINKLLINGYTLTNWTGVRFYYTSNGQPPINYRYRTASNKAGLDLATWSAVGAAVSSGALAASAATGEWFELEIILNSYGTNTPTLDSFTVEYDTPPAPPLVAILVPSGPISLAKPTIRLSGVAADPSGIQSVRWSSSRGGYSGPAIGTESWRADDIPLEEGDNTITITARDTSGAEGTAQILITRLPPDVNAPVVTITSPSINAVYATGSTPLRIGGTSSDDRGIIDMWYSNSQSGKVGSVSVNTSTGIWLSDPIALNDGINDIIITAIDEGGNEGTDNIGVTLTTNIGSDVVNIKYVPGYVNNVYGSAWGGNVGWVSFGCFDGAPSRDPVCKYSNYGALLLPHPSDPSKVLIQGYGWMGDTQGSVIPPATLGP